ncbi:hypothetical protein JCM18899A_15190 [Nocardioides sp. AN3]
MTTETKQVRATSGAGTLLGAASSALPFGFAVAVVGLAVDGPAALYAGLAATLVTAGVLAGGALFVGVVARVMPVASLLLALLTYACQVMVLTLALTAVAGSGDNTVTRWAAGSLIAVTLAWTLAHLLFATRRRIAVYDVTLPGETASALDETSEATGAGAR